MTKTKLQTQNDPYVLARVRRAYVEVLGDIWMPAVTCGQRIELRDYDLDNIGEFTRENVDQWLACNAGDFQSITDFSAACGAVRIEWSDLDNETKFFDCIYGGEND